MLRVLGVPERLLHAIADAVVVVLGLDDGDGDVGLVIEDVVGQLGLAAGDHLAPDNDPSFGESDLFANLQHRSHPACWTAGVMNLAQMSRSLRSFLFIQISSHTGEACRLLGLTGWFLNPQVLLNHNSNLVISP